MGWVDWWGKKLITNLVFQLRPVTGGHGEWYFRWQLFDSWLIDASAQSSVFWACSYIESVRKRKGRVVFEDDSKICCWLWRWNLLHWRDVSPVWFTHLSKRLRDYDLLCFIIYRDCHTSMLEYVFSMSTTFDPWERIKFTNSNPQVIRPLCHGPCCHPGPSQDMVLARKSRDS